MSFQLVNVCITIYARLCQACNTFAPQIRSRHCSPRPASLSTSFSKLSSAILFSFRFCTAWNPPWNLISPLVFYPCVCFWEYFSFICIYFFSSCFVFILLTEKLAVIYISSLSFWHLPNVNLLNDVLQLCVLATLVFVWPRYLNGKLSG